MVWGMRVSHLIHKRSLQGIAIGVLLVIQGCSTSSDEVMAPPSNHELSSQQERRMTAILAGAASATPIGEPAPSLLPATGIRWSDVPRAMAKAAASQDLAVLRHRDIGADEVVYELTSVPGWPAEVTVRRLTNAPWVDATAAIGPRPELPGARARAQRLRASFLEWMRTYGAMKRVEPFTRFDGTPSAD
tara:strand:+ start:17853 stop:18419 length:567 start_codon:yes stop_codon:yes gene_type:complete